MKADSIQSIIGCSEGKLALLTTATRMVALLYNFVVLVDNFHLDLELTTISA